VWRVKQDSDWTTSVGVFSWCVNWHICQWRLVISDASGLCPPTSRPPCLTIHVDKAILICESGQVVRFVPQSGLSRQGRRLVYLTRFTGSTCGSIHGQTLTRGCQTLTHASTSVSASFCVNRVRFVPHTCMYKTIPVTSRVCETEECERN